MPAEESFRDGDHLYEVHIAPASFPTRLFHGPSSGGLAELVFAGGAQLSTALLARLFDRRWKVTVSRGEPNRAAASWQVVHTEFLSTPHRAQERRSELLAQWRPGELADRDALSFRDRRRMRLQTKRDG